jgi:hypothetical protein
MFVDFGNCMNTINGAECSVWRSNIAKSYSYTSYPRCELTGGNAHGNHIVLATYGCSRERTFYMPVNIPLHAPDDRK